VLRIGHLGHDLLDSLHTRPSRACDLQREVGRKNYQVVHESLVRLAKNGLVEQTDKVWHITEKGRQQLFALNVYRSPGVRSGRRGPNTGDK
jgi:DNA-binding PadR family transcriptional regulator